MGDRHTSSVDPVTDKVDPADQLPRVRRDETSCRASLEPNLVYTPTKYCIFCCRRHGMSCLGRLLWPGTMWGECPWVRHKFGWLMCQTFDAPGSADEGAWDVRIEVSQCVLVVTSKFWQMKGDWTRLPHEICRRSVRDTYICTIYAYAAGENGRGCQVNPRSLNLIFPDLRKYVMTRVCLAWQPYPGDPGQRALFTLSVDVSSTESRPTVKSRRGARCLCRTF